MNREEYKELVEKKYNKPLKEIMYELCVKSDLVPIEGAGILEVPKETFLYWRNQFRFGPMQLEYDRAEKINATSRSLYMQELQGIDLTRPLSLEDEKSLSGFKEAVQRYLEITKAKMLLSPSDDLSKLHIQMQIASLENIIHLLDS